MRLTMREYGNIIIICIGSQQNQDTCSLLRVTSPPVCIRKTQCKLDTLSTTSEVLPIVQDYMQGSIKDYQTSFGMFVLFYVYTLEILGKENEPQEWEPPVLPTL